jgi:hypothetical protein
MHTSGSSVHINVLIGEQSLVALPVEFSIAASKVTVLVPSHEQ